MLQKRRYTCWFNNLNGIQWDSILFDGIQYIENYSVH